MSQEPLAKSVVKDVSGGVLMFAKPESCSERALAQERMQARRDESKVIWHFPGAP